MPEKDEEESPDEEAAEDPREENEPSHQQQTPRNEPEDERSPVTRPGCRRIYPGGREEYVGSTGELSQEDEEERQEEKEEEEEEEEVHIFARIVTDPIAVALYPDDDNQAEEEKEGCILCLGIRVSPLSKWSRSTWFIIMVFIATVVIVPTTLNMLLAPKLTPTPTQTQFSTPGPSPTQKPSSPLIPRKTTIKNTLLNVSSEKDINDPNSTQGKAFTWISTEDDQQLGPDDPNLIQRYILALLYFSFQGPEWVSSKGWLKSHECSWQHIGCDDSRFVTKITLGKKKLVGILPTEIVALTSLQEIDLSDNEISGYMPTGIGALSNLTKLNLKQTKISGSIPNDINSLLQLDHLILSNTRLEGNVHLDKICTLTNLVWLELGTDDPRDWHNYFRWIKNDFIPSSIPVSIGNLTKLSVLEMNAISLNETIPSQVGQLDSLEVFSMYSNSLKGPIPTEIGQLRHLKELRLNLNDLSGAVPSSLGNLSNLEILRLEINERLTGTLPATICQDTNIPNLFGVWITCNVQCCVDCCSYCNPRPRDLCS